MLMSSRLKTQNDVITNSNIKRTWTHWTAIVFGSYGIFAVDFRTIFQLAHDHSSL
jgi:hypothetical protein